MSDKDVLVIGYPRSGNGYTSRLLGDILNSPVTGIGSAHPICEEGLDRPGPYTVRQLHLRPNWTIKSGDAVQNAWTFAPACYGGEKIVLVIRDPRDVAISAMHYWGRPSLQDTLFCMGEGRGPLAGVGSWPAFMDLWFNQFMHNPHFGWICAYAVYYESLLSSPVEVLRGLFDSLKLPEEDGRLAMALERQAFDVRKKELASSGDRYMYGADLQVKNLRKGKAGDWKNHFDRETGQQAQLYFGAWLKYFGYTNDEFWWKKL